MFVINSLARGGAETQLLRVAESTKTAGHDVAVATLLGSNDFADQIERMGITLWSPINTAAGWNPIYGFRLAARLIKWKPDVTVSFLFQATLFTRLVNVVMRPGLRVASMRNERLESRLRSMLYRATCFMDDLIVVNSNSARRRLQADNTIPKSDRTVRVIYNGVDVGGIRQAISKPRAQMRNMLGVRQEETLFLGVGRLTKQKDWATFIRAAERVDNLEVRCFIAGTGGLDGELSEFVCERGVEDKVTFLGLRGDIPDLMNAADCLVLCSLNEGTPNVVLEALSVDLPVIVTDVGACAELVLGYDAEVIPPANPAALGDAMRRRVGRDNRRDSYRGRDVFDRKFSWKVIGKQWTRLLEC